MSKNFISQITCFYGSFVSSLGLRVCTSYSSYLAGSLVIRFAWEGDVWGDISARVPFRNTILDGFGFWGIELATSWGFCVVQTPRTSISGKICLIEGMLLTVVVGILGRILGLRMRRSDGENDIVTGLEQVEWHVVVGVLVRFTTGIAEVDVDFCWMCCHFWVRHTSWAAYRSSFFNCFSANSAAVNCCPPFFPKPPFPCVHGPGLLHYGSFDLFGPVDPDRPGASKDRPRLPEYKNVIDLRPERKVYPSCVTRGPLKSITVQKGVTLWT